MDATRTLFYISQKGLDDCGPYYGSIVIYLIQRMRYPLSARRMLMVGIIGVPSLRFCSVSGFAMTVYFCMFRFVGSRIDPTDVSIVQVVLIGPIVRSSCFFTASNIMTHG